MLGVDLSSGIFRTEADPISYNITYCTWYVQKHLVVCVDIVLFCVLVSHLCCNAHKKKLALPKVPTTFVNNGSTSAAVFVTRTFRFSAQAPTVLCGPKIGRPDMSSLVHYRGFAKATALVVSSFGGDLVAEV